MTTFLIFAKQGDAFDVALGVGFLIFVAALALIQAAIRGPAHDDLRVKGGLPYCPRCNRQVSHRRDVCRACGYTFKTYGYRTAPARPRGPHRDEGFLTRFNAFVGHVQFGVGDCLGEWAAEWAVERASRRARRRAARDAAYRARGVEPGPTAWFRLLPDWQQAVLLGLAFAAPAVAVIALFMR